MDLTNYLKAGYGSVFVQTTEIKRAIDSITIDETKFKTVLWNPTRGIIADKYKFEYDIPMDQLEILAHAKETEKTGFILENYDNYLNNFAVIQQILNIYPFLKNNQSCLVIVGYNTKVISPILKELTPIIEFNLPKKDEVKKIIESISDAAKENIDEALRTEKLSKEEYDSCDFSYSNEHIEACKGMSKEEMENVLALSIIEKHKFDTKTIYKRKRAIIKSTGFMDFIQPQPLDSLGGMDLFIKYLTKRKEPFDNSESIKPKIKSILIVGVQGCGKSLITHVACSIFNWPGITLDFGAVKGGIVGQTESNIRIATKYIDAFGRCIIVADEIDKIFSNTGKGMSHETSEGMLGHFLTWSQERTSEGIFMATANSLDNLPPEFLRTRRWDAIFFVSLPNPTEIKQIIEIKNNQYKAKLPTTDDFCNSLHNERWSGAEIEQLAIDSHFESNIKSAKMEIPILAQFKAEEINKLISDASKFRRASSIYISKPKIRKVNLS